MDGSTTISTSPPTQKTATSSSPNGGTKCPAPFLSKTYDLLEAPGYEDVVGWNEEGTGIVVSSLQEFSQELLPRYFKHCNFSSFIRQLNTYGFKKSASDRWEFRHEKFQRGKRHLLEEITRRKSEPSIYPSFLKASHEKTSLPSSSSSKAEEEHQLLLVEENKILREENSALMVEIEQYRSLQSELVKWLSEFVGSNNERARFAESFSVDKIANFRYRNNSL